MNKLVHLDLSILKMHKVVMYQFWYPDVKPKYREKVKLCNMDSFIIYIV